MKIAIYSRGIEEDQHQQINLLLKELEAFNVEPVFYQDFFNKFYSTVDFKTKYSTFNSSEGLDESIDCMISLGGDGTLLDTVTLVRDKGTPILGINYGRLGFLANIGKSELQTAITALVTRTYVIDKRTLLHLDANWADGLIVATPTGSTGYSLSCNGPVVFPDSGSFVITPVAPHNLNIRPIVVPDNNIISFEVEGRADGFLCTLDSRREFVTKEIQLAVRKESFGINLIRLNENNFLQTLRKKLSWGLDVRN
jgi:NAD+ kinase